MDPSTLPASTLTAALLIVALGYLVACVVWPFAPCRRCHGTGRLRNPLGRTFRLCPRCRGTGRRLRTGRRLWTQLRRTHHDTTRTRGPDHRTGRDGTP
ncbi:MAG: hypothetical protein LC635_00375 [Pseudonocardiaceae bacterium]|nr:hypothetical protein [Pseudonocardiaceae bacterium]